jgi:hypothetical protein
VSGIASLSRALLVVDANEKVVAYVLTIDSEADAEFGTVIKSLTKSVSPTRAGMIARAANGAASACCNIVLNNSTCAVSSSASSIRPSSYATTKH